MKIQGKILSIKDGIVEILPERIAFKLGEIVTIHKGSKRTLDQNSLYWKYLDWIINDAGLKDQGHFSAEGFHEDLKAYFKSEGTAVYSKMEFGEWIEKVDIFVQEFFKINTAPFWILYEEVFKKEW